MTFEKLLIRAENEGRWRVVLSIENHWTHIKGHLPYFWCRGMLSHIWQHLKLWREKRKFNYPTITIDDILKAFK